MKPYNHVFLIGIKGMGMANIALLLQDKGIHVSGADVAQSFPTETELIKRTIPIIDGFDATNLPTDVDCVVYSAGHGGTTNPMVVEARTRRITVLHQAEMLQLIMADYPLSIAVCGTHGKTTTSGLLAHALTVLDMQPGYMVGASHIGSLPAGSGGKPEYFVVEADEYGIDPPRDCMPKFHLLSPRYILATNIDFDHPDIYADIEETKTAFKTFFSKAKQSNDVNVVVCADDSNSMDIVDSNMKYVSYGFSEDADYRCIQYHDNGKETDFTLLMPHNAQRETFNIMLIGKHNVSNAIGAIAILSLLGFTPDKIRTAIASFTGAERRFQYVKTVNNILFYDDYAHHPREIQATISAVRTRFPTNRLVILFQPHTFSRTQALKDDFVDALSGADRVFVAPVFASAREKADNAPTDLGALACEKNISTITSYSEKTACISAVSDYISEGDIVFTMGAGSVYEWVHDIILRIA